MIVEQQHSLKTLTANRRTITPISELTRSIFHVLASDPPCQRASLNMRLRLKQQSPEKQPPEKQSSKKQPPKKQPPEKAGGCRWSGASLNGFVLRGFVVACGLLAINQDSRAASRRYKAGADGQS
jgi:hypothetical protein